VDATYEGPHAGVFKRALHKIEGVDGDASAIVPPSPIRKVTRAVSADARPVDVKVFINAAGNVTRVQLLTKGGDVAGTALAAARQWQFTPARKHDKPVASEMVLHFR
jgi:outer membrane biosynthesis protein TonB